MVMIYQAPQWYEADLSANIDDRSRYDDWSVKIMCVATGKFFVELEADCTEITITESKVYSYFVRNYDED